MYQILVGYHSWEQRGDWMIAAAYNSSLCVADFIVVTNRAMPHLSYRSAVQPDLKRLEASLVDHKSDAGNKVLGGTQNHCQLYIRALPPDRSRCKTPHRIQVCMWLCLVL